MVLGLRALALLALGLSAAALLAAARRGLIGAGGPATLAPPTEG